MFSKSGLQRQPKIQVHTQLLLFSTVILLFCIFIGAIITVHPLYLNQFLEKAELVGLIAAIASLAGLIFCIPIGTISDKIGRKRLLIASFLLISVVLFAFFINTGLYALIVLQIAFGIFTVPVWIASEAFIKDISPIGRRGEFRSFFGTFANAGLFIGPLIGGFLAVRFGIRSLYVFFALLLLVPLILALRLKDNHVNRNRSTKREGAGEENDFLSLLKEFQRQRELKILALCTLSLYFWYAAKWIFGPLFLHNMGYSTLVIGLWLGISTAPFLLFQIPFGKLGDRLGKTKMVYLGLLISTIFIIPLGFLNSISSLLAMICIVSIGNTFAEPLIEARVTDIVPKERYGAYSGIFEFIKTLGLMLGPVGSSIFVYLFGITYSFIPSAIFFTLTLAFFLYKIFKSK